MADKISDLPAAGGSFLVDEDECNQSGVSRRVSNTQRMALFKANQYDQDLDSTDNVTFNNIDSTGIIKTDSLQEKTSDNGINIDGVVIKDAAINTGFGLNELHPMDQAVQTTDGVTFTTVNTGFGANDLHPMDQAVRTTDNVTFNNIDSTGIIKTDTINENVLNAGVTVDGVLIKDGLVDGVDVSALEADVGGFPVELKNLTTAEITQLENINATTISTVQWGFVGGNDQSLKTTDAVTFSTVNTGQGANELYDMNQNVTTTSAVTFTSVNTGQGANELYSMNQDVETTDAVTFTTVNTGQGANELYAMNQDVETTDDVTFNSVTLLTSGGTPTALNFYEEDTHNMLFDTGGAVWTATLDIDMFFTRIGKIVTMHMPSNFTGTTIASPGNDIVNSGGTLIPVRFRPVVTVSQSGKAVVNGAGISAAASITITSSGSIAIRKDASAPNWPGSQANTGMLAGAWSWRAA